MVGRCPVLTKVAPSILSANFADLGNQIALCSNADFLHVDVMDGRYVANITVGPVVVKDIKAVSALPLDVHLMIVEPEKFIDEFVAAGADIVTVHVEACPHIHRTLSLIKKAGVKAGVALNPTTSIDFLPYVLDLLDLVLLMTVNPGFGGQQFITPTLPKIQATKELLLTADHEILLEVDGGINLETAQKVVTAGADVLVAGSSIFSATDIPGTIASLQQISP